MKTFTFDKFRTERIAVWCKTRHEAEEFLKLCKEYGFCWKSGASLDATSHWGTHGYATVYVAGYARPEIEYRSIEWAVRRDYVLLEGDLIVKEYRRNIRDDGIFPILTSMTILDEMKFHDAPEKLERTSSAPDKPAGSIKEMPTACWRDAESDKPNRDGDYIVSVVAIEDCEFSPRVYRVRYDITNGWDYIEGEVITHWLDNAPLFPEVVVR